MKFVIGSETDSAHCAALKHEFLRCEDAFKDVEKYGTTMIMSAQAQEMTGVVQDAHESRWIAFKTYNAYARFVHHLYEFLLGALARDRGDTTQIMAADAELWIHSYAQRVLTARREAILIGTAPAWENHISAFPETVPPEFARKFRAIRNMSNGHVTPKRATESLTDFYDKYHKFLHMMYAHCRAHWGSHRDDAFPDLREITDFSLLIQRSKTPKPTDAA
jgi:hypothetical protein